MTTLTCPSGQAFDHHTNQCADASLVHCIETHHHHHKRSVDEEVHTVSIEKLKESTKEVYQNIKTLVKTTLQETVPTVYDRLKANYTPIFNSIRDDFEPVINDKILPRMEKFLVYAKRMGGKIFKKVQRSYELSNSTHVSVVSFADVLDEITKDMEPVLKLGRYFSARLSTPNRIKRSSEPHIFEIPELLLGYMEPALKDAFSSVTSMLSGNEDTFFSRIIMPIVFNLTGDPETMFNIKKVFWSSKAAFAPLVYEMLKRQSVFDGDGEIIRIPHEIVDEAKAFFYRETKPLIRAIFEKHLEFILSTCSKNTKLILETIDRVDYSSQSRVGLLRDSIERFMQKHLQVLQSSDSTHFSTYTITEIKKDLRPIEVTLLQIFMDYLGHLDNSVTRMLFNKESFLFKALAGEDTYAVPSGKSYDAAKTATKVSNRIRGARQS